MAIIKQYNKNTGITYVYESESYWDKEKKQPRSRRKLIGKLDPETGEVIPTGKKRHNDSQDAAVPPETDAGGAVTLCQDLERLEKENSSLRERISILESENRMLRDTLAQIRELVLKG